MNYITKTSLSILNEWKLVKKYSYSKITHKIHVIRRKFVNYYNSHLFSISYSKIISKKILRFS